MCVCVCVCVCVRVRGEEWCLEDELLFSKIYVEYKECVKIFRWTYLCSGFWDPLGFKGWLQACYDPGITRLLCIPLSTDLYCLS